jgi:hypothetical protein
MSFVCFCSNIFLSGATQKMQPELSCSKPYLSISICDSLSLRLFLATPKCSRESPHVLFSSFSLKIPFGAPHVCGFRLSLQIRFSEDVQILLLLYLYHLFWSTFLRAAAQKWAHNMVYVLILPNVCLYSAQNLLKTRYLCLKYLATSSMIWARDIGLQKFQVEHDVVAILSALSISQIWLFVLFLPNTTAKRTCVNIVSKPSLYLLICLHLWTTGSKNLNATLIYVYFRAGPLQICTWPENVFGYPYVLSFAKGNLMFYQTFCQKLKK